MSTPTPAELQRQFRQHAAHRVRGRGPAFKVLVVVGSLAWLVIIAAASQRLGLF